jgi:hypothetical protein
MPLNVIMVEEINLGVSQTTELEQGKRGDYSRKNPAGKVNCHKCNDKFAIIAV